MKNLLIGLLFLGSLSTQALEIVTLTDTPYNNLGQHEVVDFSFSISDEVLINKLYADYNFRMTCGKDYTSFVKLAKLVFECKAKFIKMIIAEGYTAKTENLFIKE